MGKAVAAVLLVFMLSLSLGLAESCAECGARATGTADGVMFQDPGPSPSNSRGGVLTQILELVKSLIAMLGLSKSSTVTATDATTPSSSAQDPSPSVACALLESNWVGVIEEAYALGMEGEDSGQLDEAVEQALDSVAGADCMTRSPIVVRCTDAWTAYQNARAGVGDVSKEARLIELASCVESSIERRQSSGVSFVPYGCWGKYRGLVDALALQSGADAAQQSFELCLVAVAVDSNCLSEYNKYQAAFMNYHAIDANTQADMLSAVKGQYASARLAYELCRKRNPVPAPSGLSCDSAYYTYRLAERSNRIAQATPSADASYQARAKQEFEAAQGAFADCRLG